MSNRNINPVITKVKTNINQLRLNEEEVLAIVSLFEYAYDFNDILVDDLNTRKRHYVETNMAIATVIRRNFMLPLSDIGRMFNKSHATILHYIKTNDNLVGNYNRQLELYKELSCQAKLFIDKYRWNIDFIDMIPSDSDKDVTIKQLRKKNGDLRLRMTVLENKLYSISKISL